MCRVFFHQPTMGKSNRKIHNYPSFQKIYSTYAKIYVRALVAVGKRKKLVKVKPKHGRILII